MTPKLGNASRTLASLLPAFALGCAPSEAAFPESAASPLLGKPLPAFARPALDGSRVDTAALGSKTVVAKFFAEYCEPCTRTLPVAQRLHESRPDVAILGISEDESQANAERVIRTYGLTFPVVLDRANVLAGRFRVSEIPVTFVAKGGTVRWVGGPDQRERDLEAALDALGQGAR